MRLHAALSIAVAVAVVLSAAPAAADVQVNSADHNAANLGNFTTESETSAALNGSIVVVGYNSSRQAGLLGSGGWNSLSGYAWSNNGGGSFTDAGFVPNGTAKLEGDPALGYDSAGTLYYASIGVDGSGISRIFVSKSTTTTTPVTFAAPVAVAGLLSGTSPFQDKEMLAVDTSGGPYNGRVYVAWSEFATIFDSNPRLLVAASTSQSPLTFGATQALSPAMGGNHGALPAVGPNGDVFVAWSTFSSFGSPSTTTLNVAKSTNGGGTFTGPTVVTTYTSTVSDMGTGGVSVRTRAFPYLAIDKTPPGSATRGNLYIVFQARPTSSASPRSEIFFTRSTDGGTTWSPPRDITSGPAATLNADSTGNDNWLPSISVSPVTGHIKVLFYSRREDMMNQNIRVYETGSTDAGVTWYERPYSSIAFRPSTGYDPLLVPTYMGDYISAVAGSSGILGAWGDARNACAPPGAASAPCSPSGRGDQDAWSLAETDATGVDLFITPWGYISGQGPLWQTPDIFVVDAMNAPIDPQINANNNLRARVRNLGSAPANGATVTFKFSPYGIGLPGPVFEQIGSPVTINAAAGSTQVVPTNWFLDPNDNNGGMWNGLKVSDFNHFCVQVDLAHGSDINLSNNHAQNNFVDVATATGPLAPFKFLVGNPFKRTVRGRLVVSGVPKGYVARLTGMPNGDYVTLQPEKLMLATLVLARPASFAQARRTRDVVAHVSLIVDNRAVGGISVRLAKANVRVPKRPVRTIALGRAQLLKGSRAVPEPRPSAAPTVRVAAPVTTVVRALSDQLRQQNIPVAVADDKTGIVSSGSVPLSHQQLVAAVPPDFAKGLPGEARGRYLISFANRSTANAVTEIQVSVRIIIDAGQVDSPIGGQLIPSNGTLEQRQIRLMSQRLKMI